MTAKRYLCATDRHYWEGLSASSKRSLEVQGGPLTAAEVATFETQPFWESAVRLRLWDDRAKVPSAATAPLTSFLGHVYRSVRL